MNNEDIVDMIDDIRRDAIYIEALLSNHKFERYVRDSLQYKLKDIKTKSSILSEEIYEDK